MFVPFYKILVMVLRPDLPAFSEFFNWVILRQILIGRLFDGYFDG